MKLFRLWLGCFLSIYLSACIHSQTKSEVKAVSKKIYSDRLAIEDPQSFSSMPSEKKEAKTLDSSTQPMILNELIEIALKQNPDLAYAYAQVEEALARVAPAGRLRDFEVKIEQWNAPLSRPYDFSKSENIMFGIRQVIPGPGKRDLRTQIALQDVQVAWALYERQKADVIVQVKKAYFESFLATQEHHIHEEHIEISRRILDIAKSNYLSGIGNQEDVLQANLEIQRLEDSRVQAHRKITSSQAMLDALLGHPANTPLTMAQLPKPKPLSISLDELLKLANEHRPELKAIEHQMTREDSSVQIAQKNSIMPDFMLSADYWLNPEMEDGYAAMIAINVPWANPKNREEIKAAKKSLATQQSAYTATQNLITYEIKDAYARLEAAWESLNIIEEKLLPLATQSFETVESSYATGGADFFRVLDALRTYLDVKLEWYEILTQVQESMADLERAAGCALDEK